MSNKMTLPNATHLIIFITIWVAGGKFMGSVGWITHPAWWMLYGFFLGTYGWKLAEVIKDKIINYKEELNENNNG